MTDLGRSVDPAKLTPDPRIFELEEALRRCREAHAVKPILPDAASPHVLKRHYLAEIICDHDRQMDMPRCACSLVNLGWHPSVGAAVDAWIEHVMGVARDA